MTRVIRITGLVAWIWRVSRCSANLIGTLCKRLANRKEKSGLAVHTW